MSKGDKPRPLSVSYKQYSDNYEAIFGKKDDTDEKVLYEDFTEEEIEEAEKRIDIIGRNGNDGLHYNEVDGES
jgi:hypothetical protein